MWWDERQAVVASEGAAAVRAVPQQPPQLPAPPRCYPPPDAAGGRDAHWWLSPASAPAVAQPEPATQPKHAAAFALLSPVQLRVDDDEPPTAADIEELGVGGAHAAVRELQVSRRRVGVASSSSAAAEARRCRVPGTARVWLKTFGCAHNASDGEYMAGQLAAQGYELVSDSASADIWLLNSCTVKGPSQTALETLLASGRAAGKALLVAGCVPQGDRDAAALEGLSLLGVTQIDAVVFAVEQTLAGNTVRLLATKALPSLDLPKVRRNSCIEIVPLSTGCLGACTYCKTVHARGKLGSYPVAALLARARQAVSDGVTEIWLSSEDTGAYGRDIGSTLAELMHAMLQLLPPDGRTVLRLGMANPPYILDQLDGVAAALAHPCCLALVHIPVQSGSDAVLSAMNREYTVAHFRACADGLQARVPGGVAVHTDVIAGFPTETEADWEATMALCRHYAFPVINISAYWPRPGTAAARLPKLPPATAKARTRALTALHESFMPHVSLVGCTLRAWFTETAADGVSLAGRSKKGVQVLVPPQPGLLGCSALVRVTAASRWSVTATVVRVLTAPGEAAPAETAAEVEEEAAVVRHTGGSRALSTVCGGDDAARVAVPHPQPASSGTAWAFERWELGTNYLSIAAVVGAAAIAAALWARATRRLP